MLIWESYFCALTYMKKIWNAVHKYKAYITVDAVMYLVLLAFIVILFVFFR